MSNPHLISAHRHIGETNMNLHSSRSHTIFRMIIESRDRSEDDSAGSSCDAVRVSVLIHMDETKNSLQFASRALRVTNCACVNEILTDAALLKRQKKEIEQLRAKLQDSHSEHFEEEILNLRNKLLQTELERIAMELEEEKKAQAEKERKLQEQAQKIKNLSSMVLNSNRDDDRDHQKKIQDGEGSIAGSSLGGSPREEQVAYK